MSSFEKYLESKGLSKATVKAYYRLAIEFLAWLDGQNTEAENVTSGDIMAYQHHLQKKGQANITRNLQLMVLRHFFDWQVSCGARQDNPAQHLKIRGSRQKKLYPLLSREELESLHYNYQVPKADDPRANRNWFSYYALSRQRNKTILGLMVWQGLTTPEIDRLALQDVNLREGRVYIAGSRKSAERVLELKPQQIFELMEYQAATRNELLKLTSQPTDRFYIAAPPAGKKAVINEKTTNIWKRLTEEVETLNFRFINFKQVRASVIIHWLKQHNLRQVQYMAGHKYVSTTETYLVGQVEDLKADIEQFHPIG